MLPPRIGGLLAYSPHGQTQDSSLSSHLIYEAFSLVKEGAMWSELNLKPNGPHSFSLGFRQALEPD